MRRFSNASCVLLVLIAAEFQAVHYPPSRRFNNVIYSSLRLDSSARLTIGIAKLCIIRRVGVLIMQYAVLPTKLVYDLISYCIHTKRPSNIFRKVDRCQVSCINLNSVIASSAIDVFLI